MPVNYTATPVCRSTTVRRHKGLHYKLTRLLASECWILNAFKCSVGLYARSKQGLMPVNQSSTGKGLLHKSDLQRRMIRTPKKIHLDSSVYKIPGWVYFITIVSNLKRPYFSEEKFNREIIDCLKEERRRVGCRIYAYCLMPEHLHLLCGPSDKEVSILDFVSQFKGKSTRIGWKYRVRGALWQRRSYDHILRTEENIRGVAEYIVNNPVRRGLVETSDQYPFSGFLDDFGVV